MGTYHDVRLGVAGAVAWLPGWAATVIIVAVCLAVALGLQKGVYRLLQKLSGEGKAPFWRAFVDQTGGPAALAALICAVAVGASLSPIDARVAAITRQVVLVALVLLIGWAAIIAAQVASRRYIRRYKIDVEDNLLARKHLTQAKILEQLLVAVLWLLTVSFALMTVPGVRQWGVSLLASAGAAGIIAGLALQPVLTNIFAGVQIAMTQPIRLEDAVIVENEWGWIEEITGTYVVVRLWDWRRMVLPLTYFIQKPFQNWTRESASLIGTVILYVDFRAPVEAMRQKLSEIAAGSHLWDKRVVNLAVTDFSEKTMQIRCLVSAKNAPETFDLRCEVREKMIAWLLEAYPDALPRDRADFKGEMAELPEGPSASNGAAGGAPTPSSDALAQGRAMVGN
ncbi:MAG TPA: mechanosensitive ion channel family protein [Caulobacteraceae bacterium]|nr:mechanosensitive ion channel family protein [Caulobacteraceae bacterium]